jgi:hypothetical protein
LFFKTNNNNQILKTFTDLPVASTKKVDKFLCTSIISGTL